jgi:hypothetical protein
MEDYDSIEVNITCSQCKKEYTFLITTKELTDWRNGMVIQDAMPRLDPNLRELLISDQSTGSPICGECFGKLFEGMEDEDDY